MTERVIHFGTGMLLRAVSAAAVDAAIRAGDFAGRIVVIQSTSHGSAAALNRQGGRFTLVERGMVHGEAVEQVTEIDAIARALVADSDWDEIRRIAATAELRVIVSNVTEAAFRLNEPIPLPEVAPETDTTDAATPPEVAPEPASPRGFPAKLTDLLHARFVAIPDAPLLFVIPTELVPDNGPALAMMVDTLARDVADADNFRQWLGGHVRFCSSLIDRITTGMPEAEVRAAIEAVSGFHDDLMTVTEPHSFWAIEGDPAALREAYPIDVASGGAVVFAPDITTYRERKLRMLNGAHTAMAPLALRAGLHTVRELMAHADLAPFLRAMLLDEIAPTSPLPPAAAFEYAETVLERFANPWLDHEWRVIATNQTAKLRLRVVPSLVGYVEQFGTMPERLVRAFAASLRYSRAVLRVNSSEGEGWWQGASYRIVDVDFDLIDWHWRSVDSTATAAAIPETTLARFAASVLSDDLIWGRDLTTIPGLKLAVVHALVALE